MVAPYTPISDIVPWTQSIAGLNQFIYSTNWTANDASDVLVYARLPNIPASDVLQLIDSSNYTVQFVGSSNTVQVTFLPLHNPVQYSIVTIMRNTPSQFLNLYTNTNFLPSMLNSDFENLVQVDQQNQLYWQQIVPRYNNSATLNVPVDTILPVLGASQFWAKNSSNTAFIPVDLSSESGGGGAPTDGPYLIYTANSELSSAFNMGSLLSGFMAQETTLGIAVPFTIPFPLAVKWGGTGLDSITPFAVLTGGITNSVPIVPIADLGGVGYVFTSSGPGAPPSWQPAPSFSDVVPVGTIIDFAGTSPPTNYVFCDGTSYDTGTKSALFSVIGYTWGGSGSNFNVPNLQGYISAGQGGALLSPDVVGTRGGSSTAALGNANMAAHTHGYTYTAQGVGFGFGFASGTNQTTASGTTNTGTGLNTTGAPFSIVQQTALVLKCIKYQ